MDKKHVHQKENKESISNDINLLSLSAKKQVSLELEDIPNTDPQEQGIVFPDQSL